MADQHKVDLMRRNLLLGSAALGAAAWIPPVFAAPGGIRATIDTGATRPPISPMIYGGFIEHIGNLINHSLWSETLDDRKFYYGVLAERDRKPDDRRGAMGYMEKWVAIGPVSAIALDTERPYVGEHSPVVTLDGAQERGMVQHGLALKSGTAYNGRIVLWADPGVTVTVRLLPGQGREALSTRVRASSQWGTQRRGGGVADAGRQRPRAPRRHRGADEAEELPHPADAGRQLHLRPRLGAQHRRPRPAPADPGSGVERGAAQRRGRGRAAAAV